MAKHRKVSDNFNNQKKDKNGWSGIKEETIEEEI